MAIRSRPHLYRCHACHWFKVITDLGDALTRGHNHFDACPACGSTQIERQSCPSFVTKLTQLVEQYRLNCKK